MKDYAAHIRVNDDGTRTRQSVEEHLIKTAEYAAEDLQEIGLSNIVRLAGLLHDVGKMREKMQTYLEKAARGEKVVRGSVNHSFAGIKILFERYGCAEDAETRLACELIAFCIGGHHGLFDIVSPEGEDGLLHRLDCSGEELQFDEVAQALSDLLQDNNDYPGEDELNQIFAKAVEEVKHYCFMTLRSYVEKYKDAQFAYGMLARLCLSAVMDGDRTDTAEFLCDKKRVKSEPDQGKMWERQLAFLEEKLKKFSSESKINQARQWISDQAKKFALKNSGIYTMEVPTGAGKTLTCLRYGLEHARVHNKRHIFFVMPLLSIIEQNAEVIRNSIEDKDLVVEHHSNVDLSDETEDELGKYEVAIETWDSPIIVTTLVQLLNTMFLGKTTSIRRFQSLCNSVIVIDEVQTIPKNMISLFNMALNFLCYCCNTTIVLCSATQPCFQHTDRKMKITDNGSIIPYNSDIWKCFQRTKVINWCKPCGYSVNEICEKVSVILQQKQSILIICNTKSIAQEMFKLFDEMRADQGNEIILYHLSTALCMKHRQNVLGDINRDLKNIEKKDEPQKVICVATQVVEAGVDFSFECVIRVIAGMDNIAQAVGRCNRNNEYGHICESYIVNLKDEKLTKLPEIAISQKVTMELLNYYDQNSSRFGDDLLSNQAITFFYQRLFHDNGIKNKFDYPTKEGTSLYTMLSDNRDFCERNVNLKRHCLRQAFKTAGKTFQVFDDCTTELIVPYDDTANEIIQELQSLLSEKYYTDLKRIAELLKQAKPYIISIFRWQYEELRMTGGLEPVENQTFDILLPGFYDNNSGLNMQGNRLQIM